MTCSINLELPKEAIVIGIKGTLKLPVPFWCPTKLETPSVSVQTVYHWYIVLVMVGSSLLPIKFCW